MVLQLFSSLSLFEGWFPLALFKLFILYKYYTYEFILDNCLILQKYYGNSRHFYKFTAFTANAKNHEIHGFREFVLALVITPVFYPEYIYRQPTEILLLYYTFKSYD
jgi:hypothetical protein